MKRETGRYIIDSTSGEEVRAFVPHPLPPDPELQLKSSDLNLLAIASEKLGKLNAISATVDVETFMYMSIRKEAVLSSRIEGTQSSLADLVRYEELTESSKDEWDVREVSGHVSAMNHGLKRFKEGFPLSSRLLREMHGVLLSDGRGSALNPGEYRTSQNWVGGTRPGNAYFVPPPPDYVMNCMSDLEKFINGDAHDIPMLIRAGLVHVQFESIHPFLDGNGRLGRQLIPFMLCAEGALKEPVLTLSSFFKTHRSEYYRRLNEVRTNGDWESWISFFLEGVISSTEEDCMSAENINSLFLSDMEKIGTLGRAAASAEKVLHYLRKHPVCSVQSVSKNLSMTFPTAQSALERLIGLDIVDEITGKARNKRYSYSEYLAIITDE